MGNLENCDIEVHLFDFQSRSYVPDRPNTLGKGLNLFIPIVLGYTV